MLKSYLLVFNLLGISREDLLNYMDTRPEIKNWFAVLPTAIFIISESDAHSLSVLLHSYLGDSYFVITEVPNSKNDGWLNKEAWDFINDPKSSGRWK